ncbi:hypothetical protein [Lacinutrix himadriensis]|uniref:hypothetical protein n=1 Tax=Lacinutrix himadriensis TaxID=641549 RepID=UPI0006E22EE3|nr:hypothetical protein [Lacinutrix himadriensis]
MRNITKPIPSQILFTYLLLIFSITAFAQVGIGTTTPASGALLDLDDANRGLLVPRVTITDLATAAPVTAPATGLLVWNLDIGTGVGFYYWDSAAWVPIGGSATANDWTLAGNAITGTEFLGTISNHALNIRSNNVDRMRVQANGQITVGYGATNALTGDQFSSIGFSAVNGYTTNGYGFWGDATSGIGAIGVSNTGVGLQGQSNSSAAVVGFGSTFGTLGDVTGGVGAQGQATTGDGVRGFSTSGEGVYGDSDSGVGVWGDSVSFDGTWGTANAGDGVYGDSNSGSGVYGISTTGIGVRGTATDDTGFAGLFLNTGTAGHGIIVGGDNRGPYTITGDSAGITGAALSIGIAGFADSTTGTGTIGLGNNLVSFNLNPNGSGVAGTGTEMGVFGYATTTTGVGVSGNGGTAAGGEGVNGIGFDGIAGYTTNLILGYGVLSYGDSGATGVKYFRMDHPLDPANKILKHASIESNEILNLYRGKEVFDANGKATVSLPDYYDAVNKNASYQLTPIGAAMPNLYIEKEVENGLFIIAGGVAGKKVSWQLTAERNGPYLQKHPNKRIMEEDKGEARGTYLMPSLYGKSEDLQMTDNFRKKNSSNTKETPSNVISKKKQKVEVSSANKKTKNTDMKNITPAENIQPKENTIEKVDSKDSDPLTKRVKINSNQE